MSRWLHVLWIENVLCNPYHRCGALMARLAVCGATLFWAIIVLIWPNSLGVTKYGPMLTQFVDEDVIAAIMGVLALCMIARLVYKSKPNPIGVVAYLIMFLFWLYADIMILASPPWQPTSAAWVTTGVLLAGFALVANPKKLRKE